MSTSASALHHWLSLRIRLSCIGVLFVGALFPPYIPSTALAPPDASGPSPQFLLVEDGFIYKTSSVSKQGSRRAYAKGSYHIVKEGESLEKLANRWGISKDTIIWANDLEAGTAIQPGQELLILPVDGVLHTVGRGQTLIRISRLYDIPVEEIAKQNEIEGGFILAGQELIIPKGLPLVAGSTEIASVVPGPDQSFDDDDDATPATKPKPTPAIETGPAKYTPSPTEGVLQKPCSSECFVTQYYHGGHFALDMQERGGGPIYAAEAGTVIRAENGWNGGYGNVIEIDHGNELVTLYGHNKSLLVKEGDSVKRGQKIAEMGNTGLVYGQTGIHVHFEVRVRGVKKNPLLYIE